MAIPVDFSVTLFLSQKDLELGAPRGPDKGGWDSEEKGFVFIVWLEKLNPGLCTW